VSFSQLVRDAVEEALRAGAVLPRCWCSSGGCGGLVAVCAAVGKGLAGRAGKAALGAEVSRGVLQESLLRPPREIIWGAAAIETQGEVCRGVCGLAGC